MAKKQTVNVSYSNFEIMRRQNNVYVDKTQYLYDLINENGMYFCARPRRFGKSLTVSTLQALFEGKKELFEGLAISKLDYDWEPYPVIRLDFAESIASTGEELETYVTTYLLPLIAKKLKVSAPKGPSNIAFASLVDTVCDTYQSQVVILIDEYDKPLSDNALAKAEDVEAIRKVLLGLYQVVKGHTEDIRFAFMTGVTKFGKLSLFSGPNHFSDISTKKAYSTLFGYTQKELEDNFSSEIEEGCEETGLDRQSFLEQLRKRYDGYCFAPGAETVYNPVSIGSFFTNDYQFDDYWTRTGWTKLVMDISKKLDFSLIDGTADEIPVSALDSYDVASLAENPNPVRLKSLLYQTGYLTIDGKFQTDDGQLWYKLRTPNMEVGRTFVNTVLENYAGIDDASRSLFVSGLIKSLKAGDAEGFLHSMQTFMAGLDYANQVPDEEKNFNLIFTVILKLLGYAVDVEKRIASGRIDTKIETKDYQYIMEFKVDESPEVALEQIKDKGYALPWRDEGKQTILCGIQFLKATRNIGTWKVEKYR